MTAQERNKNEALPNLELPKSRVVGRIADMNPKAHLRVCLDEDDDLFLGVWDARGMAVISFITPGPGGGKSPRTRSALIALMDAIEADNAEDPGRDLGPDCSGIRGPQPL